MRLIDIDMALDAIVADRYETTVVEAYKAIVNDIDELRKVIRKAMINEVYPDINADTLNELLKKRDALVILRDLGYNLQPEIDRVMTRIVEKVNMEGAPDENIGAN